MINSLDKRTKWCYCIGATGRDAAYALVSMYLLTYVQYTKKLTVAQFGAAHIRAVNPDRVRRALNKGSVAIVAGFQGQSERGDATTLGRGGSDTSAVALAVALGALVAPARDGVHVGLVQAAEWS